MQLKAELESLIADQHPSIRIVAADKSTKSEVWDNDCYLMVFRDNIKQEFALCSMCRNLITYKSCYGTGSLIRHSCFRKRKRDNMKRKLDEAMPGAEQQPDDTKYPRKKPTTSIPTSSSVDSPAIMSPPQSTSLPSGVVAAAAPHLRMNNSKHLEMLIKNKDPSVELVDRTRDEWIYKDIYNYGRRQDFVFCMVCHKTVSKYSYIQRTHQCFVDFMTGSGGAANHAAYADAIKSGLVPHMLNNTNTASANAISPTNSDTTTATSSTSAVYFTMEDKQELVQQQLYFMYHDLVPAKMIDGKGFQRLAQCLINIGAAYGKVPVKNVLIDSETMYNQQALICQTIRHNIKAIIDKYKMAFGCDMWSDIVRRKQCLTLTAHYIDDNFELKKIVLGTKTITEPAATAAASAAAIGLANDASVATEGDAVLQKIYEILENYTDPNGAEKLLSRSVIVSGDATKLVAGLRAHTRISCACWALNNIVKSVLASVHTEIERISGEIKTVLNTIKETKCGHKIAPLYSEHLSDWDSIWQLFTIASDPEVQDVIDKMAIPMPIYEPYAKILQPFRLASLALSSETRPTLNAVYMFRKKLEDSLSLSYFDEPEHIKTLKMNGLKLLQEQFCISSLHKMALFLDPRFKSLKFFSNDERTEIIDMVKRMSANCTVKMPSPLVVGGQSLDSSGGLPAAKFETNSMGCNDGENGCEGVRVKCEDGQSEYLIEYMDDHTSDTESHSELNMYMSLKSDVTHSADILKFWESRVDMPHLQQLAKEVLCIPASATAAEQLFSDDAKLLAKRRLFMEPDELDRTLLIHGTSPKLSM